MAFCYYVSDGGSDCGYRGLFRRAAVLGFLCEKSLFAGRRIQCLIALCHRGPASIQAERRKRRHPRLDRNFFYRRGERRKSDRQPRAGLVGLP